MKLIVSGWMAGRSSMRYAGVAVAARCVMSEEGRGSGGLRKSRLIQSLTDQTEGARGS